MITRRLKLAIPLLMIASVVLFFEFNGSFNAILPGKGFTFTTPETPSLHTTIRSGLNSDSWIPLIISECIDGLNKDAAPCIQQRNPDSNLIKAQELIYKPFRLRVPRFISKKHKDQWLEAVKDLDRLRISNDMEWADYPTANAQNLVFANAVYDGSPPPDEWSNVGCMNIAVSHDSFLQSPIPETKAFDHETLVIATSPDSWSWQHFLDRVTIVWSQSLFAINDHDRSNSSMISGRAPNSPFVDEMYTMMGVKSHVHYETGNRQPQSAKNLVFSCRAPLVHPYTTQRVSEMMGVDLHKVPLSKRKVILYMSRSHGDIANSGRQIVNEEEFLERLEALIKKRGLGEKLELFDRRKYSSVQDIIQYLTQNVMAIIGPHGSAFHNGRFASSDTLIYEFMPDGRFQSCFWEQSHLLEQNYFSYMAKSLNDDNDMQIVEMDAVIQILDENLGKVPKPTLVESYPWKII
ncbi:hypothetical protein K7432_006977 [Basidiobolus ranarum]|uniref:Glycosyltransferase 61 catalytic domain-containing protein n=1 Tax=Basidiobolus ranarum TaxID=34480 RepID=A0ABR2WU07_9FUNG